MTTTLPSAEALMKTTSFCKEAQAYRDSQFEKKLTQAKNSRGSDPQLIEAGQAMLGVLRGRTAQAIAKEAAIKDGWTVSDIKAGSNPLEEDKYEQQKNEISEADRAIDNMINELRAAEVPFVRLDVAFDSKSASAFLGYTSPDVGAIDERLGAPVFPSLVSEAMFIQNGLIGREHEKGLICRDGVFYQANSRTEIAKDANGDPLLATREQIDTGLAILQTRLNEQGINCQVAFHSYEETKRVFDQAKAAAPVPAEAPTAPQPSSAAPKVKPDEESGGVQPDM